MVEVDLVHGGLSPIERVKVLHEGLEPLMGLIVEEMPVEACIRVPFPPLAYLSPHEEQLLARLGKHIRVKEARFANLFQRSPGILSRSARLPYTTSS